MTHAGARGAALHKTMLRFAGRGIALLLRSGVRLGPMMLLTVRGRTSGLPRTNPVDVFAVDGRSWLVSTHGVGDSSWVRNLRAAGVGTLTCGRRQFPFTAVELSRAQAGVVLREVVAARMARRVTGFVLRRTLGVPPGATLETFVHAADRHPVFEVTLT